MTERRTKDGWGNRAGQPWSEQDYARLVRLREVSSNWPWIAAHFPGRSVMACRSKHHSHFVQRHRPVLTGAPGASVPSGWPQERLAIEHMNRPYRTDLTGVVCGDPAPGRSALDGCNRAQPPRISLPQLACLQQGLGE